MYQFIKKDGVTLAFAEEVRFIRQNPSSGAYVGATEDDAQGVVVDNTPYALTGRVPLSGAAGTVSVVALTTAELEKAQGRADRDAAIAEHKAYLTATDYVVMKIAEAQAEGDTEEVTALQNLYAPELARRKRARAEINGLQAENELAEE